MRNPFSVDIAGIGTYEPPHRWTNQRLIDTFGSLWYKDNGIKIDSSDSWIRENIGIEERRFAEDESLLEMAVKAAERALEASGIPASEVGYVRLATNTHPDNSEYPSIGWQVQAKLGLGKACKEARYLKETAHAPAPDIQAGCTGMIYGIIDAYYAMVASQFEGSRPINTSLVIGAEKLSDMMNFEDRDTCILLGDAATAIVLQIGEAKGEKPGIVAVHYSGVGDKNRDILWETPGMGTNLHGNQVYKNYFHMAGSTVLKFGSMKGAETTRVLADIAQKEVSEIKLHTPHSANQRIIDNMAKQLQIPTDKFHLTLPWNGNTSVVATGLNLYDAKQKELISPGDLVSVVAFGAGLSYGGYLLRASESFLSHR